ncbi:unnamed protein product [Ascophyllum nodosum]
MSSNRRKPSGLKGMGKLPLVVVVVVMLLLAAVVPRTLGQGDDGTTSKEGLLESFSNEHKKVKPAKRSATTLDHFLAGTVGGMSGLLVSYPIDTLRVRMQTGRGSASAIRTASNLLKEAGVAGFYRGIMSPLVGTSVIEASIFGGYGFFQGVIRRVTGRAHGQLTLAQIGAAALGTGLTGAFVITPIERVKVFMQVAFASSSSKAALARRGAPRYANAWSCARGLLAEQGLRQGLFVGLRATILKEIVGYPAYFIAYEACKRYLLRKQGKGGRDSRRAVMYKTALAGSIAGVASWLSIYPLDVVKNRMQSLAGPGRGGFFATAGVMLKEEGPAVFIRGLGPSLVRAAVNHGAVFLAYETVMSWMSGEDGPWEPPAEVEAGL